MREKAQKLLADLKTILLQNKKLLKDIELLNSDFKLEEGHKVDLEEGHKVDEEQTTDEVQPQSE